MKTTQQLDEYIISYINNRLIITGDNDDYVLSCNIRHDLDVSYQAIAKILLSLAPYPSLFITPSSSTLFVISVYIAL